MGSRSFSSRRHLRLDASPSFKSLRQGALLHALLPFRRVSSVLPFRHPASSCSCIFDRLRSYDTILEPFSTCISDSRPAKYEPIAFVPSSLLLVKVTRRRELILVFLSDQGWSVPSTAFSRDLPLRCEDGRLIIISHVMRRLNKRQLSGDISEVPSSSEDPIAPEGHS